VQQGRRTLIFHQQLIPAYPAPPGNLNARRDRNAQAEAIPGFRFGTRDDDSLARPVPPRVALKDGPYAVEAFTPVGGSDDDEARGARGWADRFPVTVCRQVDSMGDNLHVSAGRESRAEFAGVQGGVGKNARRDGD
jgi:hypothetical protein